MRKALIAIGVIVALLVVAVVAAPFVIPVETYKGQIEQRVEDATGRKLTIGGPMKFSLLPTLGVTARDVRFANAAGAAEPNMATLAGLEIGLKLLPLLSGEVAIDRFVLDRPVIHLEIDQKGRANWQFATAKPNRAQAADEPSPEGRDSAGQGSGALDELRLDNVELRDGRVSYRDARSGTTYAAEAINLTLSLPDLDSPFRADGGLTWNGKPVKLTLNLTDPRAVMDGKASALAANVSGDLVRFDLRGTVAAPGGDQPAKLDGDVDLSVPNVRSAAAWLGQPLTVPGSGLGPLAIKGKLAVAGPKVGFSGAELSLDAIRAKGDIALDAGGKVPMIKAKLATNTLDLNPYLPPSTAAPSSAKSAPAAGAAAPTPRMSEGWSSEPLDLSGLRAANADLALTVDGLVIRKIKIGKGDLAVRLNNGKLDATLRELALYQGSGKGDVTLDGSGKVPSLALDLSLAGVQAEPILADVMELDRLSGTARSEIEVRGSGASQADIVKSLRGKGNLHFENGAIKGVNLGALVRNVSTAFLDAQAGRAQQTDFSELSGTFVIDQGIVKNDDLTLQAPLLRLGGAGTVDLPQRSLNYRLEPRLAATAEGQGGRQEAAGVTVPVVVQGPWDNLSYKPDISSLLKDPQGALQGLRGILGGQGQGGESGGGAEGGGSGERQPAPSNPVDQLRGLFGR